MAGLWWYSETDVNRLGLSQASNRGLDPSSNAGILMGQPLNKKPFCWSSVGYTGRQFIVLFPCLLAVPFSLLYYELPAAGYTVTVCLRRQLNRDGFAFGVEGLNNDLEKLRLHLLAKGIFPSCPFPFKSLQSGTFQHRKGQLVLPLAGEPVVKV